MSPKARTLMISLAVLTGAFSLVIAGVAVSKGAWGLTIGPWLTVLAMTIVVARLVREQD